MMLEACELGIGSVWVRGFDSRKVAKAFELPGHIKPVCLLPIGYPSVESKPYAPWHDTYRSIEEWWKNYNGKIRNGDKYCGNHKRNNNG